VAARANAEAEARFNAPTTVGKEHRSIRVELSETAFLRRFLET